MYNKYQISSNINLLSICDDLKIGTKAKNIKIAKEIGGCLIPKTLIINTNIFKQLLNQCKISNPAHYDWSKFKIPIEYQKIFCEKIYQEFNNKSLVIRSSATCEDSPLFSFAGQYSSFLNIRGEDNIINAINLCYRSLFSDNAKIYAKINNVQLGHESMAIAVQELAPIITAGVMFTSNPVNKNTGEIIIEYTKGLGDSVVSGHKKPLIKKIKKIEINRLQNIFFKKISKEALRLEEVFGCPQDIEWGWNGKKFYIFQSRNITTLKNQPNIIQYSFDKNKIIGTGICICRGVSIGRLTIINNIKDYDKINKGDVVFINCDTDISLITKFPLINALIVKGGILSHIAVIAREFNIPCLTEPKIINKKIEKYINKKIIVDSIKNKILIT